MASCGTESTLLILQAQAIVKTVYQQITTYSKRNGSLPYIAASVFQHHFREMHAFYNLDPIHLKSKQLTGSLKNCEYLMENFVSRLFLFPALLLYPEFNRCYYQLLRVRLDRTVAPCSRPTTNVIGPLHECKKVCPCTKALLQSGIRAHESRFEEKEKKRQSRPRSI